MMHARKPSRPFADRAEAGRLLAQRLIALHLDAPVVLALPRGGVPIAVEIARALKAPLDLVLVRKIGTPRQPEVAAAAVVDGGAPEIVVNEDVLRHSGMGMRWIEEQAKDELSEIERRRATYLGGRPRVALDGRVLILVDDGIATGASIRAAISALRRKAPARLVLATPVAPRSTLRELAAIVDDVVCLEMPEPFFAIGMQYADFHQLEDTEVIALLDAYQRDRDAAAGHSMHPDDEPAR